MFSTPQYTTSELQPYNYFVMQEPVFEEKIQEPVLTCVYKENGVLYCASSTSKGVYWYTYCLNNPLTYTDPTGEKWWHWVLAAMGLGIIPPGTVETVAATVATKVSSSATIGFFDGLPDEFSKGFDEASRRASNLWDISMGLFQVDETQGDDFNQFMQVVSRFTWQQPMTLIGYKYANFLTRSITIAGL